ncbi:hypothetical protein KHA80_21350 [Anaerobacillus sp. HL2]|nr:hypothetical protein KHA80_21350 [Anaerobacillus sp. HL2]
MSTIVSCTLFVLILATLAKELSFDLQIITYLVVISLFLFLFGLKLKTKFRIIQEKDETYEVEKK